MKYEIPKKLSYGTLASIDTSSLFSQLSRMGCFAVSCNKCILGSSANMTGIDCGVISGSITTTVIDRLVGQGIITKSEGLDLMLMSGVK